MQDVARALKGLEFSKEVIKLTAALPDEFEELSLKDHEELFIKAKSDDQQIKDDANQEIAKYQSFYTFRQLDSENERLVQLAYKLVGKIKAQGTHAGGIIIADRPINEVVPLSYMNGNWTSQWTEGRTPQLSKFGLVKYDILGLKTMYYIWRACELIKQTDNITIDWDMDPTTNPQRAGWEILPDGSRRIIDFNDKKALIDCNELRTDSVFQIETPLFKNIIKDGKVKTFRDLIVYNAMGRPGPIECIAKGSLINTSNGYKKIESLDNDEILYQSKTGTKTTKKYRVFYNGKKKLFKVKLSNGTNLLLTGDHLVYTTRGFRKVKDISKGDRVYAKRRGDLEAVEIVEIEEYEEGDVYDISNFEDDCMDNEGNFFCNDILVHNCIPDYIKRRDDPTESWRQGVDERITDILKDTYNIICYQEQLTSLWIRLAGFTVPESETARKVIAKKWADKLKKVEEQWITGATKTIGEEEAKKWWSLMYSFGRYAFNISHSTAYSVLTYRCMYLKSHYPAQWWAAVLTECHDKKLSGYISSARADGVKFGSLDVNNLSHVFSISDDKVVPGLQFIKGMGEQASKALSEISRSNKIESIDDLVKLYGKKKNIYERLIKMGAFDKLHNNRRGLWMYYLYRYGSREDSREVRELVTKRFMWDERLILEERAKRRNDFLKLHPKRKVMPKAIENWMPKISPTRDDVIGLYDDYTDREKLAIEKELLGYYWSNPMHVFVTTGLTVDKARNGDYGAIEGIVESVTRRTSKSGNSYYMFRVFDGIRSADVVVWTDTYRSMDRLLIKPGAGIKIYVKHDSERDSFCINNNTQIIPLLRKDEINSVKNEMVDNIQPTECLEGDFPLI